MVFASRPLAALPNIYKKYVLKKLLYFQLYCLKIFNTGV